MKNSILILLAAFLLTACQVEEKVSPTNDIIAGHKSHPNAFVIVDPIPGDYVTGDTVSFTMRFPLPVNVDSSVGEPYLILDVGGNLIGAEYVSGDGTTDLIFEYTVNALDSDTNGIDVFALAFNGAEITYEYGHSTRDCRSEITSKHFYNISINL